MKKHIFFVIWFLFINTVYSQVLYTENFDNHSVGNLGTDVTGTKSGQWGWFTKSNVTQANSFFTIVNETNRGKVLDITAVSHTEGLYAFKKNIDKLIDNRTAGNDVIKFEIDYFTGSKQPQGANNTLDIKLLPIGEEEGGVINPDVLCAFNYFKDTGIVSGNFGYAGATPNIGYAPFNSWLKLIAYLDYPNRKLYFEIPALNKVIAGDLLKNNPSTNLIQDYKPATISLTTTFYIHDTTQPPVLTRNRYDNIKITALKNVPPEVIALSTNEQLVAKFNLYPNPATNVVNITNSENMLVNQVTVYDIVGKQLSTQTFSNQTQIQLNVENLASGTYMLHVETAQGTAVKKLVKK